MYSSGNRNLGSRSQPARQLLRPSYAAAAHVAGASDRDLEEAIQQSLLEEAIQRSLQDVQHQPTTVSSHNGASRHAQAGGVVVPSVSSSSIQPALDEEDCTYEQQAAILAAILFERQLSVVHVEPIQRPSTSGAERAGPTPQRSPSPPPTRTQQLAILAAIQAEQRKASAAAASPWGPGGGAGSVAVPPMSLTPPQQQHTQGVVANTHALPLCGPRSESGSGAKGRKVRSISPPPTREQQQAVLAAILAEQRRNKALTGATASAAAAAAAGGGGTASSDPRVWLARPDATAASPATPEDPYPSLPLSTSSQTRPPQQQHHHNHHPHHTAVTPAVHWEGRQGSFGVSLPGPPSMPQQERYDPLARARYDPLARASVPVRRSRAAAAGARPRASVRVLNTRSLPGVVRSAASDDGSSGSRLVAEDEEVEDLQRLSALDLEWDLRLEGFKQVHVSPLDDAILNDRDEALDLRILKGMEEDKGQGSSGAWQGVSQADMLRMMASAAAASSAQDEDAAADEVERFAVRRVGDQNDYRVLLAAMLDNDWWPLAGGGGKHLKFRRTIADGTVQMMMWACTPSDSRKGIQNVRAKLAKLDREANECAEALAAGSSSRAVPAASTAATSSRRSFATAS